MEAGSRQERISRPSLERRFRPPHRVDLALTLGPLCRGRGDPTMRIGPDGIWRATRTLCGPATLWVRSAGDEVVARAWGPGAGLALDGAPALVGAEDDDGGFAPAHPLLAELHHRLPGLRIPRSGAVFEAVVPTICEQKVTSVEARRSWTALVRANGEPAPGPDGGGSAPGPRGSAPGPRGSAPGPRGSAPGPRTGARGGAPALTLPPAPDVLAGLPSWAFHRFGLERRRADTIRRAAASAGRLEEAARMPPGDAQRRLMALPGLGPWSAAEVALVALGDADAVSLGDWHRPHQVCWALAGEERGDDERMLELLEPYRGQRGRVLRLLAAAQVWAPRFGPRLPARSIRAM